MFGTPVAGEVITLRDSFGAIIATTTTDTLGAYTFTGLLAGSYTVDGPGIAGPVTLPETLVAGAALTGVDFTTPTGAISGTVSVDNTHAPLAGVTVELVDSLGVVVASAVTAADGTYTLPNLAPGVYTVRETIPTVWAFGALSPTGTRTVTVAGGSTSSATDLSVKGSTLSGQVLFQGSNMPAAGSTVTIVNTSTGVTTVLPVAADGTYRLADLPADPYTVTVTPPAGYSVGNLPATVTPTPGAGATVSNVDFNVLGAAISGQVLRADLTPLPGTTVHLLNASGIEIATAAAGPDGSYAFSDLPAGSYTVTADGVTTRRSVAPTAGEVVPHQDFQLANAYSAESSRLDSSLPVVRLIDTRITGNKPAAGEITRVHVADDAVAAVFQLTSDNGVAPGYMTAYSCTAQVPLASNVNFPAMWPSSSLVTIPLDANGDVCVYVSQSVNVVIDRMAVYRLSPIAAEGRFIPMAPTRLLDTRGPDGGGRFDWNETRTYQATGVPAGAQAVVINLTGTNAVGGYVSAFPAGATWNITSSLNLLDDQDETRANMVIVPLSADGKFSILSQRPADIVIDVEGYYTGTNAEVSTTGLYVPRNPTRLLDTREAGSRPADSTLVTDLTELGAPANVSGLALTITHIANDAGYVTAYPADETRPLASIVNGTNGTIKPNLWQGYTSNGKLAIYTQSNSELVLDLAGFFTS